MAEELIKVPDIGGAEGAEIVEVLVAPGDTIDLEQSLVVVESDKASMEIPAPMVGTVAELRVAVGDAVSEGDVILVLKTDGAASDVEAQGDVQHADSTDGDALGGESAPAVAAVSPEANTAPLSDAAESAGPAATAHTDTIEVKIPDLGSDQGADLVEILVPVGSEVEEGDSLVLLESDKASMEVPAPVAGTVLEWLVETGATLTEGVVIAKLALNAAAQVATPARDPVLDPSAASSVSEPLGTAGPLSAAQESSPEAAMTDKRVGQSEPAFARHDANVTETASEAGAVYAGPAVRKLAREFGVPLSKVPGTGARGRILKEDLQQYVAQTLANGGAAAGAGIPDIPDQDYARFGAIEQIPRSRIDKVTASNMVRSWLNVPHVTQFDDADISGMERFRAELKLEAAERGVKLTPLPFILKACAAALRDHPKLKSSLTDGGETLVMKHYCHIGMAVDTPAGLLVPVIRDVDKKSIWELAAEVAHVAAKAKDRQLKPDDMQGGVFTVSSLGALGGRGFTPIINAPEVAILGVGRASVQPVWDGEVFRPHTLLPLALSYDHRVVNGGDGGRFLTDLTALLSDVKRMVM